MVESAAHLIGDRLDLMRVNAAFLGNETADLQAEFDEIVLGSAYDGIASRNGATEYLLLREHCVPSGVLLQRLGAAAEQRAISREQLGLEANSLQLSVLGEPLNPANIRRAARSLRQGNQPVKQWEGVVMKQPFWLRPGVLVAGLPAFVAIGWLLT